MPPTATLTDQRAAALKAAQDIIDNAKTEGRDLTDDEITEVETKQGEVTDFDKKIKSQAVVKGVLALGTADTDDDGDDKPAATLGDHFIHHGKDALARFKNGERLSWSSPEFKAATDPQVSPTMSTIETIAVPQVDRTII